jgi:hypothetical protein
MQIEVAGQLGRLNLRDFDTENLAAVERRYGPTV